MMSGGRPTRNLGESQAHCAAPSEQFDCFGSPGRANQNERIIVARSVCLPGVEVWHAETSARPWRVYHEDYAFCTSLAKRLPPVVEWRYRGRSFEWFPGLQQLFEPGLAHESSRPHRPADF